VWGYGFYGRGMYWYEGPGWAPWKPDVTEFFGKYAPIVGYPIMYVEDCHFSEMRHALDNTQGGFTCARYCRFDNSLNRYPAGMGDMHFSGRGLELYECTFIENPAYVWGSGVPQQSNWAYQLRGGSGLFYNNNFTSTNTNCNYVYLEVEYPAYPEQCVKNTYLWNNYYNGVLMTGSSTHYIQKDRPLTENNQYFLRAPSAAQDGFSYTPYRYPHPLTAG
jgi:hypothetical protein